MTATFTTQGFASIATKTASIYIADKKDMEASELGCTLANYYPFTQNQAEPLNNFCSGFDFHYEIDGNLLTMHASTKAIANFDDYSNALQTDPTNAEFGYGRSGSSNTQAGFDGTYTFQATPNGAKVSRQRRTFQLTIPAVAIHHSAHYAL